MHQLFFLFALRLLLFAVALSFVPVGVKESMHSDRHPNQQVEKVTKA